jgi:hypothetical protein
MALREACDMLKLEITSAARYKMPRTLLISSKGTIIRCQYLPCKFEIQYSWDILIRAL